MKRICAVFKSTKQDEMYLYVDKLEGTKRVPDELLEIFGEPEEVMTLLITPEKKLARVEGQKVLDQIAEKGFFLQMPPPKDGYLLDLYMTPTEARY